MDYVVWGGCLFVVAWMLRDAWVRGERGEL